MVRADTSERKKVMTTLQEFRCEVCGIVTNDPIHWFVIRCGDSELTVQRGAPTRLAPPERGITAVRVTPRCTSAAGLTQCALHRGPTSPGALRTSLGRPVLGPGKPPGQTCVNQVLFGEIVCLGRSFPRAARLSLAEHAQSRESVARRFPSPRPATEAYIVFVAGPFSLCLYTNYIIKYVNECLLVPRYYFLACWTPSVGIPQRSKNSACFLGLANRCNMVRRRFGEIGSS
jgi:hypothetical protein